MTVIKGPPSPEKKTRRCCGFDSAHSVLLPVLASISPSTYTQTKHFYAASAFSLDKNVVSECGATRRDTNDEHKRATHQTTRPVFNWTVGHFREGRRRASIRSGYSAQTCSRNAGGLQPEQNSIASLSDEQHFRGFYQLLILVFYCAAFPTKWGETQNRLQHQPSSSFQWPSPSSVFPLLYRPFIFF